MLGVVDIFIGLTVAGLALTVVAASFRRGVFSRLFYVNLSVSVMLVCDVLRYIALYHYGFRSVHYFLVFYFTDALLVTTTYLLILSFFDVIFANTPLRLQVRWALLGFICLVGLASYAMISRTMPNFYSRLMIELLQNMYFGAVVLTVLVWISLTHLRVDDRQMALLIGGLGLAFSVQAANYAIHNLISADVRKELSFVLLRIPQIATILKVGVWAYAVAMVTEGSVMRQPQPAWVRAESYGSAAGVKGAA